MHIIKEKSLDALCNHFTVQNIHPLYVCIRYRLHCFMFVSNSQLLHSQALVCILCLSIYCVCSAFYLELMMGCCPCQCCSSSTKHQQLRQQLSCHFVPLKVPVCCLENTVLKMVIVKPLLKLRDTAN